MWEVYFSKELCFVRHYCVDYVSACIWVCYTRIGASIFLLFLFSSLSLSLPLFYLFSSLYSSIFVFLLSLSLSLCFLLHPSPSLLSLHFFSLSLFPFLHSRFPLYFPLSISLFPIFSPLYLSHLSLYHCLPFSQFLTFFLFSLFFFFFLLSCAPIFFFYIFPDNFFLPLLHLDLFLNYLSFKSLL